MSAASSGTLLAVALDQRERDVRMRARPCRRPASSHAIALRSIAVARSNRATVGGGQAEIEHRADLRLGTAVAPAQVGYMPVAVRPQPRLPSQAWLQGGMPWREHCGKLGLPVALPADSRPARALRQLRLQRGDRVGRADQFAARDQDVGIALGAA